MKVPPDPATIRLILNADEYDAVKAAVAQIAAAGRTGEAPSLNSLLARWSDLVEEVDDGYSWCAPEFDNDLWCRSALARIWPLLPPRVRALRQAELDGIDERYRRATIPWPGHPEHGARWWTWRVPRRLDVEVSGHRESDWPLGWEMVPFPRPACVEVRTWAAGSSGR